MIECYDELRICYAQSHMLLPTVVWDGTPLCAKSYVVTYRRMGAEAHVADPASIGGATPNLCQIYMYIRHHHHYGNASF